MTSLIERLRANALPLPPGHDHNPIGAAMDDYDALRGNYAAAISQLNEVHDIASQFAHANAALEATLRQERAYYREEMNHLRRERDMLAGFSARLRARLDTISEVISAAVDEAAKIAMQVRPADEQVNEEAEAADAREIAENIARINPPYDAEMDDLPSSDTAPRKIISTTMLPANVWK